MKTALILSGGMDSATLLYHLLEQGDEVICLTFNYGQRHKKEIELARQLAEYVSCKWQLVDLSGLKDLIKGNSQTDDSIPVPEGHYAEENMKLTIVPNRNMMMLAIAGAVALSEKCDRLAYGAHAGDHAIYPDCRLEFVIAMRVAFGLCDWNKLDLIVPFQEKSKGDIAKRGLELGVPYEKTWTCYAGQEKPCGKCGACTERREAFEFAGQPDPLEGEK